MDPVTQGALGAAFAQCGANKGKLVPVGILGCLAGMAPDLDVLIRSSVDPLLSLEFHRQFTHSLLFIPLGALIVAAALFPWSRRRLSWRESYLACLFGYASHGLLDACTSYGTQLLWPLSNMRVAWNNVSVVDPLFTVPLLVAVIFAAVKSKLQWVLGGMAWAAAYLLFGLLQAERVYTAAELLAAERGHDPARLTVKPGFANLLVWKSIYQHDGRYYVDGVRAGVDMQRCGGTSVVKLDIQAQLAWLEQGSQQAMDIERFRWFSQDYLALHDGQHGSGEFLVIDMRYSLVPSQVDPMWGIMLDRRRLSDQHSQWWSVRQLTPEKRAAFAHMLRGSGCERIGDYG